MPGALGPDRRGVIRDGLQSLADLAARTAGAYVAGYLEANPAPAWPPRTVVRPPGARPEREFRARCTGCGDCVGACPYDALAPGLDGFPWLWDPAGHPCYMCDGYPCIAACGTGALILGDRRLRTIGLAEIAPQSCLAHQGEVCTSCRDACRDARAISLLDGLPAVAKERCTGCGLCLGKCPAPGGAIAVVPR